MPGINPHTSRKSYDAGKVKSGTASTEDDSSPEAIEWDTILMLSGMLSWPPKTLYAASLPELFLVMEGWQKANGIDSEAGAKSRPMTHEELNALIESMDKS